MIGLRNPRRLPTGMAVVGLWLGVAVDTCPGDLARQIPEVKRAVVAVGTVSPLRQPKAKFLGTAFVVADGQHVLTNAHVLPEVLDAEQQEELALFVGEGSEARGRRASRVAVDARHDLALLRFGGRPLPSLSLGASDRVREGEDYAFTGFPIGMVLGLHPVTHRGMISAVTPIATPRGKAGELTGTQIKRLTKPFQVFQLDATAYPGNSGSPLYDPGDGRVVGIVNMVFVKESKEAILERPSGITYAIPIEHARKLLGKEGLD